MSFGDLRQGSESYADEREDEKDMRRLRRVNEMRRKIAEDERRNTMMKGRDTMTRGEGLSCEDDRDEV